MHVVENTKIWDAIKSQHLYFWASNPKFVILARDNENNY